MKFQLKASYTVQPQSWFSYFLQNFTISSNSGWCTKSNISERPFTRHKTLICFNEHTFAKRILHKNRTKRLSRNNATTFNVFR